MNFRTYRFHLLHLPLYSCNQFFNIHTKFYLLLINKYESSDSESYLILLYKTNLFHITLKNKVLLECPKPFPSYDIWEKVMFQLQ